MNGPYTVTVDDTFEAWSTVCDAQGFPVASFAPGLNDLAEETRDRLNVRDLATKGAT